jgi:hypothetical protein
VDPDQIEKAEASIDQFIAKRARERADADKVDELWAESTRRHKERRREENRQAWREYERHLERVHMDLALEHRAKAEKLLGQDERKEPT